jgi:2-polyprenyl-3-methyl-5-hydroxy-6-metoxy-1,4-benzoquinol methylase
MRAAVYVHAGADFESERHRLHLLETRYDEGTIRRISALGPLEGARCLEVGAGAGSVARWLAGRVGENGHVVATDLDPRFLAGLEGPNLEVRRHDILVDDLEAGAYDLVHCRALLLHLPDPERGLARMFAAVRPGGLLLVEDADFVSMVATDPAHRLSAAFDRTNRSILAWIEAEHRFDPWFGRRLPALVAGLGVVGAGYEATVAIRQGGSPGATLHRESARRGRAAMRAANLVPERDFDALDEATADPSFTFFDAVSVAAWGHRPSRPPG